VTIEQTTDLVDQLRQAIEKSGHTLNEIERRCGVSHAALSRFLRGERSLTLPIAAKLCSMLGLRLCAGEKPVEAPTAKRGKKWKGE
jgi:transcriptional regulator with XRE-family HTH domain